MSLINAIISNFSNQNISLFFEYKITSFKPEKDIFTDTVNPEAPYSDPIKIGHAELKNHEELLVFTCQYNKELTERSAKKQQFEIAKKVLKEDFKDGAIFIFYDEQSNFRFSFIRRNYGDKTAKYSNWKRYTYYVEPSKQNKTFKNRIENCHFDSLESIQETFSVEPLNKQFYQQIAKSFYELISGKYKLGSKSITVEQPMLELPSTPYASNENIYKEFAVRLIGRTIFCWFLKNKKSNAGIPLIPESWLSLGSVEEKKDYYHSTLEKLFFLALNKKMDERSGLNLPDEAENIPFLNGGLFEAHTDDFFVNNKANYALKIPNEWFKTLFETLEQYNFTIDENSINDTEVSIDPEMLGTIFENLLAEIDPDTEKSARKSTGSFYTPREIVDYMVEQSMVQYLKTKTTVEDEQELLQLFQEGQATTTNPSFTENESKQLLEALSTVKILDPACGSGAFPMGALHKICLALEKLDPSAVWWKEQQVKLIPNAIAKKQLKEKLDKSTSDYARKLGVIQNSIYGVDIQPIAAEISKLRSFLSLVIDENIDDEAENRGIEPLPNLEFKFVTANTLVGLPEDKDRQVGLFENFEQLDELAQLRADYLQCSGNEKEKIKQNFLEVQRKAFTKEHNLFADQNSRSYKLISWNPFVNEGSSWFDPQWMFGVEKFDVVVGNPPYVNVEKIDKSIKNIVKNFSTAYQKYDLYVLFYEIGIKLLKEKGVLSYITSNKFLSQGYGLKLRQLFLKYRINKIVNFNYDVFDAATVRTCIFELNKMQTNENNILVIDVNTEKDKHLFKNKVYKEVNQNVFEKTDNNNFRINLSEEKIKLLRKIEYNSLRVDDICSVNYGLRPVSLIKGNDKFSFIKENYQKGFKKYFEGKDSGYWNVKTHRYLRYKKEEIYNPMFEELFEKPKLAGLCTLSEIGKLRFVYDDSSFYCNHSLALLNLWVNFKDVNYSTVKRLISKDKIQTSENYSLEYLQGILNSKIIKFYVNELLYDGTHFYPNHMKQLPIKIKSNYFSEIESLVLKIRNAINNLELISDLDTLVYKLYNLTHEEVLIVDPKFSLTKEEYNNYTIES